VPLPLLARVPRPAATITAAVVTIVAPFGKPAPA
jgi:hypothetical protein